MNTHAHIRRAVFELAALAGNEQPHVSVLRAVALRQARALTIEEAAAGLGVSVKTVYNLCAEGELTRTVERGYVTRRSFDNYLDTHLCAGGGSNIAHGGDHGLATAPTGQYSRGGATVARLAHTQQVGGSTPSPATSLTAEAVTKSARGRSLRGAVPVAQPEPYSATGEQR